MSTHTCSKLESDVVVLFTLRPLLFQRKTLWHLLSKYLDGLQNSLTRWRTENALSCQECPFIVLVIPNSFNCRIVSEWVGIFVTVN
jgi:hypothetical protein